MPLATGRRNWTFAGSDEGGRRAAAIYTLIETARRHARAGEPVGWHTGATAADRAQHLIGYAALKDAPEGPARVQVSFQLGIFEGLGEQAGYGTPFRSSHCHRLELADVDALFC